MAESGVFGDIQIAGNWAQKRMIGQVLLAAQEQTSLASPAICPVMPFGKLKGTIPLLGDVPVASQLKEFEYAIAGTGKASSYDIELLKGPRDPAGLRRGDDRVRRRQPDDPPADRRRRGARGRPEQADPRRKLNTTPQVYGTGGDLGNWTSVKATLATGKLSAAMGVHRPSALVMGTLAGEYYAEAVGDKVAIQNLNEWRNARLDSPDAQDPDLRQH